VRGIGWLAADEFWPPGVGVVTTLAKITDHHMTWMSEPNNVVSLLTALLTNQKLIAFPQQRLLSQSITYLAICAVRKQVLA
jgi:hypothetical protein